MTQLEIERPNKELYRKQLRCWRSLQGFGGLIVATCFFLPNIEVCSSPFVPAVEIFGDIDFSISQVTSRSAGDWLGDAWIVLPYVIGLAIAVTSIRYRHYRIERERHLGRTVHILMTAWALVFLTLVVGDLGIGWALADVPLFGLAIVVTFYCGLAAFRGNAGLLCNRWFSSVCLVFWFVYWIAVSIADDSRTYYGIWLALGGSCLIFAATLAEATIGGVIGWRLALRRLATCSLKTQFLDDDRCTQCGYLLIGLTSNRCPECGQFIHGEPP